MNRERFRTERSLFRFPLYKRAAVWYNRCRSRVRAFAHKGEEQWKKINGRPGTVCRPRETSG